MEGCAHVLVGEEGVFRLTPYAPTPGACTTYVRHGSITGGSFHKYYFCRDKTLFVVTKHVFSRDKRMLVVTKVSSRKNHNKYNFVSINVLSRQAYFCRDKHVFVATKIMLLAAPAIDTVVPFYLCLD